MMSREPSVSEPGRAHAELFAQLRDKSSSALPTLPTLLSAGHMEKEDKDAEEAGGGGDDKEE